ncbi:hypothetical protein E6C27_scaffold190G00380 [Cucumis melo var. makuwa]|uniref:DUF1677 domain-containing protein n=2 Tax=Cucumis melo TaxID=3656 RepID=A0A5A7UJ52_CUCMM|nr:hypothetical protein E6C27_scaffold190G00380 [Cucumis melo var. makuwa]
MSATLITEPMAAISPPVPENPAAAVLIGQMDVEFAKCECCGLTEECTGAYIEGIRRRFDGKWICGLCSEAVQDEILKSDELITTEEAIAKHMSFCKKFAAAVGPPPDPTPHLISAMRQILRRSLDSPRALRSSPATPTTAADNQIRRRALA